MLAFRIAKRANGAQLGDARPGVGMDRQKLAFRALPRIGRAVVVSALLLQFWPSETGVGQGLQTAIQTTPGQSSSSNTRSPVMANDPMGPIVSPNPLRLEHMREDERRKRLMADTARLVTLTNELKAELDKASKDELSLDVVRKAAEIEKLAHDVKERMKS